MSGSALQVAIQAMNKAHAAFDAERDRVWDTLRQEHPEIDAALAQHGFKAHRAKPWFFHRVFDHRSRCAAELIADGRSEEVLSRLLQMAYGMSA